MKIVTSYNSTNDLKSKVIRLYVNGLKLEIKSYQKCLDNSAWGNSEDRADYKDAILELKGQIKALTAKK